MIIFPTEEYVRMAVRVIHGTLALSERHLCSRGHYEKSEDRTRFQEDIVIPNGRVLTRLKSAVRFSRAGFDLLLRNLGLPVGCLQPLTANTKELQPEVDLQISGLLSRKPIIATGTDVVVASPTELLPALRNALIALAQDRGVADELADRFGSATWQAVAEHLSYVKCDAIPCRAGLERTPTSGS